MRELAEEIIQGRRLQRGEDLSFLVTADLKELCEGADLIRRELCGNRADLCSIINGRGGRCSENCKFCAQSAHNHTNCEVYDFLSAETFVEDCRKIRAKGVDRYSIVTAGKTLVGKDLEIAVESYRAMHEACPDMILCASHGLMEEADLKRLADVGVTMYHANIETSERFFPEICNTHTFEDKIEEVRRARAAGMTICCGGILGMGETWEDRISMALKLAELAVESIPLNFLIPVKGTPLGNREKLAPEEITRIVAMFRYINPTADIRIAAGRSYFEDGGEVLFTSGANATLTGDMLTTVGNNTAQDREMLTRLGYEIKPVP
ncbi:MAG: biotin synthase BioB [Lachnospiraceae bacterium]|nr:biotin synthase BioB [Lachnospiraceae bacterium]